MTPALLKMRDALGGPGLAGAALLAALAGFHFAVLGPLQARTAALQERVARQAPSAPAGGSGHAVDEVRAVYAFLKRDEQTTDWLAKLHAIGKASGVQLKSASYRTAPGEGGIARYEIVLPLAGGYSQIRDFLSRASAEVPIMSIDQLTLKRENRNARTLQAEVRLTLHMVKS